MNFKNRSYDGKRRLNRRRLPRVLARRGRKQSRVDGAAHRRRDRARPRTQVPGPAICRPLSDRGRDRRLLLYSPLGRSQKGKIIPLHRMGPQPLAHAVSSAVSGMRKVMREVAAGLLECCCRALSK